MSIFADVSKYFLIKHLKEEIRRAESWNESQIFSTLSGRDVDHSKAKITQVKNLCKEIMGLVDQRNDKETEIKLQNHINDCKDNAKILCTESDHGLGQLNVVLTNATLLLAGIHHVFKKDENIYNIQPELNPKASPTYDILIETPSSRYRDPLDIILYHAAVYYAKKYQQQEEQGWWGAKVQSFFSSTAKVRVEKEDLLHTTISNLKEALALTENDRALHRANRIKIAIMCLSSILGENNRICKSHTVGSSLPLPGMGWVGWLGDLTIQWDHAPGDLKEAMQTALDEIKALAKTLAEQKDQEKLPPPKNEKDGKEKKEEAANDDSDEELEKNSPKRPGHKKSISLGAGPTMFAQKTDRRSAGEELDRKKKTEEGVSLVH
ncbi:MULTISPECIES: hypothetical protein [Legionella]|uniref:Uncharacterized protein n=1 Tax=Legionella drozanskii LLAP-1 TaxID=1212489 RepID=A0A0W0SXK6_9GAMM|nr:MULTISPECIES: hypothetical protein [Legionella]KTC88094.1 hypothetical protein Ldro_1713 [Legionella drozanskii LLAP-1]PJE08137.1 MAG: hypothetical protein CK430_12885 [Legionella sp.]